MNPAVFGLGLRRGFRIFEIFLKDAGAAEHHLAIIGDPQFDIRRRRAHRIRFDFVVGLDGDKDAGFGAAIKLF